jgi:hypothetical protein
MLVTLSVVVAVFLSYWYQPGVPATIISILVGGGAPGGVYLAWEAFLVSFRQEEDSKAESRTLVRDADELAESVRIQWSDEAIVRQFNDYSQLMITWTAAMESLTVDWNELVKLARGGLGRPALSAQVTWATGPAGLTGFDRTLPDVLRRVPTGWLVVLGGAGSGKTMLMLRLVLDLLARRQPGNGDPVPVLVPVTSWDPEKGTLFGWLEERLTIDHPGLGEFVTTDRGEQSRIAALLAQRKIIPVLDGLDEMPAAARRKVIARLNDVLALPACPPQLLITCRDFEYAEAVGDYGRGWSPLRGAAAIELHDLDADHVEAYLSDTGRDRRWQEVAKELRKRDSPVGEALRTPLYVSLAARIYNPHPDDPEDLPGELKSPDELTAYQDAEGIKDHLLDEFIRAAYRPDKEQAKRAEDWLELLARYLESKKETSLQWWTLHRLGPPMLVPTVVGIVCAIGAGLAAATDTHAGVGIGFGFGAGLLIAMGVAQAINVAKRARIERPGPGIAGGLIGGAIGGVLAGVAAKAHIGHDPSLLSGLPEALGMGLGAGASSSPVGGFVGALAGGFVGGLAEGTGLGLPAVIVNGLAVGLAAGLGVAYVGRAKPARRTPEWNAGFGVTGGVVVGLAAGVIAGSEEGPIAGAVAALLIGAAACWPIGLAHTEQKLNTVPSPEQSLLRDAKAFRRASISAGLAAGVFGFVGGSMTSIFAVGAKVNLHIVLSDGLGIGLASALVVGLAFGFYHAASPGFLIVSWWLALTRGMPWRLKRFLDDAYRRSILRQAGAEYQFRHESLQNHLSDKPLPDRSQRPQDIPPAPAQRRE